MEQQGAIPKLRTKVIATIGPATLDPTVFKELILAGVDLIRINTAYGDRDQYDLILRNLKETESLRDVKVLLDIKGFDILDYSVEKQIDPIALSFAENVDQIKEIRKRVPSAFVISKIESEKGAENFDAILDASDGIMVARGDLALAVSLEKVPPLQKDFTIKTLKKGKLLVAATEMLLSMVHKPQPTRAEVSDVANAVFDNSSAVMLSEETAIGDYPVEAVKMMRRVIAEAEKWNDSHPQCP